MTLARVTERIAEKKHKDLNIDGRRFSKRSQKKICYEIRDLMKSGPKPRGGGRNRGALSKAEIIEYKKYDDEIREQEKLEKTEKLVRSVLDDIISKIYTSKVKEGNNSNNNSNNSNNTSTSHN